MLLGFSEADRVASSSILIALVQIQSFYTQNSGVTSKMMKEENCESGIQKSEARGT